MHLEQKSIKSKLLRRFPQQTSKWCWKGYWRGPGFRTWLSSWVISFVEPQFTHLVRMDRMICTHRLNEIMYVKEFNESGDWRRGTWTGHGCDKWVFQACIFPPISLGGTERNHQKKKKSQFLLVRNSVFLNNTRARISKADDLPTCVSHYLGWLVLGIL